MGQKVLSAVQHLARSIALDKWQARWVSPTRKAEWTKRVVLIRFVSWPIGSEKPGTPSSLFTSPRPSRVTNVLGLTLFKKKDHGPWLSLLSGGVGRCRAHTPHLSPLSGAIAELERLLERQVAPEDYERLLCRNSGTSHLANDWLRANVWARETMLRNILTIMIIIIMTEKADKRTREAEARTKMN